jgi:ribosomal protein L10
MTLQERLNTFESEARGRIQRVLATGNEKLLELDEALAKVAKDDWSVPRVKREIDGLRARADTLRAKTLKRASELPTEAVHRLATGTRAPIQNLAKGLADIARRLDAAKPANGASKANGGAAKANGDKA